MRNLLSKRALLGAALALFAVLVAISMPGAGAVPVVDPAPDPSINPPDQHDPFTQWSLGPDPIPYAALSVAERARVDALDAWAGTSHSAGMHAAYSSATAEADDRVRTELAARLAAMQGIENLGVLP